MVERPHRGLEEREQPYPGEPGPQTRGLGDPRSRRADFSFAMRAPAVAQTARRADGSSLIQYRTHLSTMKWYYVENGQQAGPVEDTEFPQLIQSGKLRAETLVWREGMANWEPASAACP